MFTKRWLLWVVWGVLVLGGITAVYARTRATTNSYLPLITRSGTPPPQIAGCDVFPGDNIWNTPVDNLPVHARSSGYINTIGASRTVHADFGSGVWPPGSNSPIGIPFITVPANQPNVPITFVWWPEESDPGPYPIPPNAPIEGGAAGDGDRHVLVLQQGTCKLFELYSAFPQSGGGWEAGNGAVYDLNSHALRPDGWTSADAAGLPILPGLVRYDEVASGEIRHAIRFTAPETQAAHLWPARHHASNQTGANYPPMGLRLRLRADYDISGFSPDVQVILRAFKRYGLILADNGSAWYISGAPDARWDNDQLHEMDVIRGSDFEAVEVSGLIVEPNSGRVKK
ncbi:MAG: hypothetical protein H6668_15845 [Ardenticatenaceae bacterium]|nr:hypothetical protein [Ardenticatenaceae bacterium]